LPVDPPIVDVPTNLSPQAMRDLSYAIGDPEGGYKVQTLIGLYLTAPYLHDGGVAASADALQQKSDGYYSIAKPDEIGLSGTLMKWIAPDPEANLRVLIDRDLRAAAIAANRADRDLQITNIDGSGHNYWVDRTAGFTSQEQTDLTQLLLSIDDDPAILPSAPAHLAQR
jgi:hypothetical protein